MFKVLEFYRFLFRPRTHGVYVAVWYDDELLLVENSYRPGLYFPSGGVKSGERALEAARRELREEVGLTVPQDDFVLIFEMQVDHDNMRDHVSTFEVRLGEQPTLVIDRREVVAARFVARSKVPELELAAVVRAYIDQRKLGRR